MSEFDWMAWMDAQPKPAERPWIHYILHITEKGVPVYRPKPYAKS